MTKSSYWLAGASALVMMAGPAFAQSTSTTSETVTVAPPAISAPAPDESYSATKTSRSVDDNGVEVDKTKSFEKHQSYDGENSTRSTTQTTVAPSAPVPPSYSSSTTTTRTDQ